jgi:hypothetical protein
MKRSALVDELLALVAGTPDQARIRAEVLDLAVVYASGAGEDGPEPAWLAGLPCALLERLAQRLAAVPEGPARYPHLLDALGWELLGRVCRATLGVSLWPVLNALAPELACAEHEAAFCAQAPRRLLALLAPRLAGYGAGVRAVLAAWAAALGTSSPGSG